VRGAAIEALASFTVGPGHPQHGELLARLVHLLRDGEPVIRESAGRTLRQYPGAAEHVARVLVEDANPSAREEAAETLRRKFEPSESSVRSLIKALGDEVAAVRRAAQRALAAYHRVPDSGEDLFRYLGAKQDWDGLSRQGPAAVSYLAGLLRDRDEEVRLKAVRTLGTVRDPGSAGDVSALLSDPSQDVRKETARVLARLGNAGVVAALKSARLKEGFEDVRKELDSAISRLGGEA
jgi:HEAT repeat protein